MNVCLHVPVCAVEPDRGLAQDHHGVEPPAGGHRMPKHPGAGVAASRARRQPLSTRGVDPPGV